MVINNSLLTINNTGLALYFHPKIDTCSGEENSSAEKTPPMTTPLSDFTGLAEFDQ